MADKTTTLKTKTNDNVYPNVIGDNRKDAFVDSSTIKHHFYDQTHKVGFQISNDANIKIQNSLQKPAGLTKTKLVGVGTNGQENIEIGDNLTLANGKLSATGGGEEILNVSVSMTAEQLSQSINNSGIGTSYTEENKIIVFNFIKAQKGIMRLKINTPIGNLYMTLRPSLWKDDNNHSYNFEGSLYIESDLSAIGAKYFNQIIVRAICWDNNQSIDFRPTIIPIGDN